VRYLERYLDEAVTSDTEQINPQENVMKNALLALFVVPLLTMPAFAGSLAVGDKPMVVAENVEVGVGGVGVGVGERHRHREHRHHHDDRR
jgi:hypothetical protein